MARDCIEITVAVLEDDHNDIPVATDFDDISTDEGSFVEFGSTIKLLVDIDSDRYHENVVESGNTEGINQ